ncbi:SIMPL domain-containing protein [uncultured Ferrimonas sp.]|uniref:SIMPL domain-containing protein n=1 Tax=uncultured Ferrimonas sp. TaxID=432640 RepID=UPI00261DF030|nr:SIMPL domain-containing protein [uncultured Ferrimonas sp.]
MKRAGWLLLLVMGSAQAGFIEVSGQAALELEPKTARLSATIETRADSAKGAKAAADSVVAKVLQAFSSEALPANSYKAGHLQLGPQYDYRNDRQKFLGYQAQRQISLTVAVADVAYWLEQFTELGLNQVNPPQYQTQLTDSQRDQLLQRALQDALQKAQVLALASAQELGKVLEIHVNNGGARPMMRMSAMADAESYHAGTMAEQLSLRVKVALD